MFPLADMLQRLSPKRNVKDKPALVLENPRDLFLKEQKLKVYESFSFACGGWLQFYMFGVAKAIQERNIRPHIKKMAGCSAGALTAVGLALDGDFDKAIDFCKAELVPKCYHHWTGWGLLGIGEYASRCMDATCNLHRWEELEDGQLHVAITRLPFFHAERQTSFSSEKDLKTALLASAGCFPFAPLVWRKDHWCIDGGLSDFQPVIDENTITVSPFYFSSADIRPSRYVPLWWSFFPPKDEDTIEWLYHLGQEDAISFFAAVDDTVEQLAAVTPRAGGDRRDEEGELSDDTPFFPLSPNPSGDGSMLSPPSEDGSSYNSSDTAATTSSSTLSAPLTPGRRIIREEELKRRAEIQRKRAARLAEDSGHAYDIRRRVSVHRFLGYNTVGNVGVKWLVYAADLLLLIFLVAFWKPLALLAVYTELICRIAGHLFYAVAREMLQLLPMISLAMAFCDPHLTLAYGLILLLLIQKLYVVGPVVALPASQGDLWQTARCLMSLSLMRRFVSGGLSREDLRQHDLLMEHSVVYRVIRHII